MKLIVITSPQFLDQEALAIETLFKAGLEILHLRKPQASQEEVEFLLQQIPQQYHNRIVTHEHFNLLNKYNLKGIHLNGRNPQAPEGYQGHISCSCHSLQEVIEKKTLCQYVFLSPIYNSISKVGYPSNFQKSELIEAAQAGIIDAQVIALGGIQAERLSEVKAIGFGGAAMLGDIWQHSGHELTEHFTHLIQQIS